MTSCSFFACNNSTDQKVSDLKPTKTFKLIHQKNIVLNSKEVPFGRLRQEFVNSYEDDYWAFHDFTNQQIFVFRSNGDFISTIGSEGSGPAEFQNVYGYSFTDGSTLWAFDENLDLFKHFNLNDSLLATVPGIYEDGFLQSHPQLFVNKDKLYIPITEAEYNTQDLSLIWKSALVAVYNTNGDYLYTLGNFGNPVKDPDTYNVRALLDIDFNQEIILAGFSTSYQLGEFMYGTEEQSYFGDAPNNFMLPSEKTSVNDSYNEILEKGLSRSAPMGAYITDEYYVFYYQNLSQEWYDTRDPNTKEHFLAFYERQNPAYVGELQLPYALGNLSRDGEIRLIHSIDPDQYTVGVYSLSVEQDD